MELRKKLLLTGLIFIFLFSGFLPGHGSETDIVILHTNDIHGRIEMAEGILGMPLIGALIKDYRLKYQHVLVLDAGDTIHGQPITNSLEGESTVKAMNAAGYDVMVPGNHDFNFGYERLLELEEMMEFDLISANVFKDGELLFKPYVVKELGNYRVGIFGISTPDTYTTTHPDNIKGLEFGDMVTAARKYVQVLKDDYDVDLIVGLGHVGFAGDYPSKEIADKVEGIDLFVDGHSHHRLPEGEWHHGTLFVQANEYSKYLGKVLIDMSSSEPAFSPSLISAAQAKDYEPVQEIVEILKEAREEARRKLLGL